MSETPIEEEVPETPKEVVGQSIAKALGLFGDEPKKEEAEPASTPATKEEEDSEASDKQEVVEENKPEPKEEPTHISAKDLRVKKKEKVRAEDIQPKEEPAPKEKEEPKPEPKVEEDEFATFAPKEKKTLELLKFGESKEMAGKGTTKKLAEFYKNRADFIQRLKEDNIDDEEYSIESDPKFRKWQAQNKPPVDVETMEDIRQEKLIATAEERAIERIRKENAESEAERAKYMEEIDKDRKRPGVEKEVDQFSDDVLQVMPEEVTSLLKSGKTWENIEEDSPLAAPIVKSVLNEYSDKAEVLVSMDAGVINYDPSNPIHKELRSFIATQADILKGKPESETTKGGKKFVHPSDYKGEPNTWTLGKPEILKMLRKKASIVAKSRIESEQKKIEAYNKKMGYTKPSQNSEAEDEGSPSLKPSPTSSSSPSSGLKGRSLYALLN